MYLDILSLFFRSMSLLFGIQMLKNNTMITEAYLSRIEIVSQGSQDNSHVYKQALAIEITRCLK